MADLKDLQQQPEQDLKDHQQLAEQTEETNVTFNLMDVWTLCD